MSLVDDYRAIREKAAIGSISARAPLAVAGRDRASYLQGLLTNDIQALVPGTGCYAAWLSPQGRMLTDMHVLESGQLILLDVPAETAAATLERLDQFVFSEDVRLESLADALAGVWIHGPGAAAVVEGTLVGTPGVSGWQDYQHGQFGFAGTPVSVARIDQLGVPGYSIYVDRAHEANLVSALQSHGARAVGRESLEAARVEAGYPIFGVDMTDTTIPLEAGIEDRAISFSKGCYVGQEVIVRVLHRGGGRVARKLVAFRVTQPSTEGAPTSADALRGAKVFSADREIGQLTSAAESPRHGTIALGYVHRDFASPGTVVAVKSDRGSASATITERPMAAADM
jgi:folate-binding protein YgfZ